MKSIRSTSSGSIDVRGYVRDCLIIAFRRADVYYGHGVSVNEVSLSSGIEPKKIKGMLCQTYTPTLREFLTVMYCLGCSLTLDNWRPVPPDINLEFANFL